MENTYRIPGNTKHNISFIFRLRYEEENLLRLPAKKKKKVSLLVNIILLFIGSSTLLTNWTLFD